MDDYSLLIIAWLGLGAMVGLLIGKSKGRPEAGFFFGAFLGFIGWLIVAAGPDYRRKCPMCCGAVPDEAQLCQHCGSSLA